ncbi:hypothetical protein ACIBL5_06010 [Streptomyces sp. NPDC050516]|uniref:hypothetical protein n=1 Tax=Streptomyces sp. NPDC050516 TaxID=3365621 RepID=UPI0037B7242F
MTTDRPRERTMPLAQEARLFALLIEGALVSHNGDAALASERSGGLRDLWAALEPEVRRYLLLFATWPVRNTSWHGGGSMAERYAAELARFATRWAAKNPGAGWAAFCSAPHSAFSLASSLAFDRDDLDVSWTTAVLLLARAGRAAKAGE